MVHTLPVRWYQSKSELFGLITYSICILRGRFEACDGDEMKSSHPTETRSSSVMLLYKFIECSSSITMKKYLTAKTYFCLYTYWQLGRNSLHLYIQVTFLHVVFFFNHLSQHTLNFIIFFSLDELKSKFCTTWVFYQVQTLREITSKILSHLPQMAYAYTILWVVNYFMSVFRGVNHEQNVTRASKRGLH